MGERIAAEDYHTYLKDMQGSTTNLVKHDGTLSAAYNYSDFGETEEITGNDFDNQICYTGGIYDESTELYYLNARYYDPATGRFISQDTFRGTVDDPGQWHLYAYCANNPINCVDPSGHKKQFVGWGIQLEVAIQCGFSGLQFIWLNKKIDERYNNKNFHLYSYSGGSFAVEDKNKIRNHVKNHPKDLKTKDGLIKIKNLVKNNLSASVCILALWANTKKVDSYKDLEGGFISITLTGYHATISLGIGSYSAVAGFGISTAKANISISAGQANFRPKYTNACRNGLSNISSYVKGKAEDL